MVLALLRWTALAASVLLLAACEEATPQATQAAPPAPKVTVVSIRARSVPLTRELVGRLAAVRTAQVRARVPGIILERVYTEGTDVKAGDVLFRIDPAQLEATLHAQQAAVAKAEADAASAALTAERYLDLYAKHQASRQERDTAVASERITAAAVQQAKANVELAELNLGYATVKAPIAGRADKSLVDEGALVGEGEATPLTTIEQIDPIYVNFSFSERELAALRDSAAADRVSPVAETKTRVEVELPDGTLYPHAGILDFSALSVNPDTGSVAMRAVLANPDRRLLPGMFVKVHITLGEIDHAFVLPQAAVARDTDGAYVLVVGEGGKVEQRRVETVRMTGSDWILTGQLADGDRVIVAGIQKVRPGAVADAVEEGAPASPPARH